MSVLFFKLSSWHLQFDDHISLPVAVLSACMDKSTSTKYNQQLATKVGQGAGVPVNSGSDTFIRQSWHSDCF